MRLENVILKSRVDDCNKITAFNNVLENILFCKYIEPHTLVLTINCEFDFFGKLQVYNFYGYFLDDLNTEHIEESRILKLFAIPCYDYDDGRIRGLKIIDYKVFENYQLQGIGGRALNEIIKWVSLQDELKYIKGNLSVNDIQSFPYGYEGLRRFYEHRGFMFINDYDFVRQQSNVCSQKTTETKG